MTIMLKFKSDVAKRRLWTRKVTAVGLAFFLSSPLVAAADREMTQGNLEQYSLSAISALAERAVTALVPR